MKLRELNKILSGNSRVYLEKVGTAAVLALASRWVKTVVIIVFLAVGLWLLYSQVWQTFQGDVVLPFAISAVKPQLKVEVLRDINLGRSNRVKHKVADYSRYERLFFIPSEE
jgi:hypothetical protein